MTAQFAMECRVSPAAHPLFLHIQTPDEKFTVQMWTGTSNHLLAEFAHGEEWKGWLKANEAPGTVQPFCTAELSEDDMFRLQRYRV